MSSFKDKIEKLKSQIKYFPKILALIWNSSKYLLILWGVILILLGILPALQIYLIKPLIDGLSNISKDNLIEKTVELYLPITILILTIFFTPILSSILTWVRAIQSEKIQNSIRKKIQNKAISLDMIHFENSEYYDKLFRAHIDALNKPSALLENIGTFFQQSLTLIAILFILIPISWWLPIVLLFISIPSLFIALKFTLKLHNHRISNTKNQRKLQYFDNLMTNNDSAPEIRTFNLGNYLKKEYWILKDKIQEKYFNIIKSQLKAEILNSIINFIIIVAVMFYMINEALNGNITIGMLVMYYFAFTQGQSILKTLFANLSELYKNITFLENLFEFLDIKNSKQKTIHKLSKENDIEIKIKNIYFKYPNANKYAIEDLSLTLNKNKITAIVGTNGSGKSTLIKLLNAFYYPTKGSIKINGTNITEIEPNSIRENITVLFQNFIKYHLKVSDNIHLGNINKNLSIKELEEITKLVNVNHVIKKLPKEYETVLGKWFGGAELSGGEWQKIALARAFLKDSKTVILDEPTSALDSWAEAKWLESFKQFCENKTTLIITHRFTTARYADIIYVMDKGKVIEKGSHEELLKINGSYASSWYTQTNEYKG